MKRSFRVPVLFCLVLLVVLGAGVAEANVSALQFESSNNQYVTLGQAADLGLETFTLEAWIRRDGTGATASSGAGGVSAVPLICKGRGESDGNTRDCNYFFGIQSGTDVLAADFEDLANGQNHPVVGSTPLLEGVWYHVAATYDGSTWKLYLNGALDGTETAGATPRHDSIQHASLATALNSSGSSAGYFDGVMDEVRIWNHARDETELGDNLYAELTSGSGLVARYGLDENGGTVAGNSIAGGSEGSLINGPAWVGGFPPAPTDVPAAPTDLAIVSATQVSVELSWTDTDELETGFEVERSLAGPGGPFDLLVELPAGSESYVDDDVESLSSYCYRVRAVNEVGASDSAGPECADTPEDANLALDFSGGSYVTFGSTPTLGLAEFTLECWFIREGTGSTASSGSGGVSVVPLISKGRGQSDGSNVDCNYLFGIQGDTEVLAADFEDLASGLNHPVSGITPVTSGVWHHAAVTYDGSTWNLYLDGNLESSLEVGATPRYDSIQHAGLGTAMNSSGTTAGAFDGRLDEVRIWDVARTQTQIYETINQELPTPVIGLVARYGLDEGAGTIVSSTAGPVVDGTLVGSGFSWTAGAPFDIQLQTPTAPTGLVAVGTTFTSVELAWMDASDNEAGFEVERSTTGSGGPFTQVAALAPGVENWVDNDVIPTAEYCYRVRAINPFGPSDFAGPECATVPQDGNLALTYAQNDYVTFGPTSDLGLLTFTLECWFRRDGQGVTASSGAGGVNVVPLISKGRGESDGSNVDCNYLFGIQSGTNVLAADFEDLAGGLNHPVTGVTPIEMGRWYHAAVTYDGAAWALYLDGSLEAEFVTNSQPRYDSIQHAGLGTAMNSSGAPAGSFVGVMDEVRIWDHARTLAEIQTGINAEISTPEVGLVARYGMEEGPGTTIMSSAGTAIDGTLVGDGFVWQSGAPFDINIDAPASPSDLVADGSAGSRIALAWVDNALGEIGFAIQRSTDGGLNFSALDTVGSNVTTYSDYTVSESQEYCYRVRAFNLSGVSGWSSIACASLSAEGDHALDLDGATYATFGANPALGLGQFTVECWFKPEGGGSTSNTGSGGVVAYPLVTKGRGEYDGAIVDCNWFFGIQSSNGVLAADFEDMASGLNHPVTGHTPIALDAWHHGAVTYDGTTWRLYLDGYLDAELSVGATPRFDSIQHAAIGSALNSSGVAEGFFDGFIDEARVWDHARSIDEIRATLNGPVAAEAEGLVARWGLNTGSGDVVYDNGLGAVDGMLVGSGHDWVTPGAPFDLVINDSPHVPVVSSPADGATGLPGNVPLSTVVSDPEADNLTVTFHARPVGVSTAPDFTLIGLPDTQYYSETYHEMFYAQTQWIVEQQAARNIAYVSHYGDIVEHGDNGGDPSEWIVADRAMSTLETILPPDGVPYGMNVGNHDQTPIYDPDGTTTFYNQYFGIERFLGRAYYGGHYGDNNDNHYDLFSVGDLDFIVINLEQDQTPDQPVLDWARELLDIHGDRRAIVVTHWLMGIGLPGSFSGQGQAIYDALKDAPNLFLMMGGHIHGVGRRTDVHEGNTVHSFLADYQGEANGGNAWLRVLEFSPANNRIQVRTYSPYLDQWRVDDGNQFALTYDMGSDPFREVGVVSGVASGATATVLFEDLEPNTRYEWYAEVSDGITTTTGPVWTFTTAAELSAADIPARTRLEGNFPNPFNPRTTVAFDLAQAGPVQVKIYSVDGRLVRTLVDEHLESGSHRFVWNGNDGVGRPVASGTYFLRLQTTGVTETGRMMLVR